VQSFFAALPYQFLNIFSKWLKAGSKTGTPNPTLPLITFGNMCVFVRCECKMKVLGIAESSLEQFGIPSDEAMQYKVIHGAMTKADKPASHHKVIQGGAHLPACSFDPLIMDAFEACSKDWTKLCFVPGVTNVALDDDKINKTLPKWKLHGMQTHPTKDKIMKPFIHTVASIGTGMICVLNPEIIGMKLGEMLKEVI
jgi:hypothetical protein